MKKEVVYGIIISAFVIAISTINVRLMNDDLTSYSSLTLERLEAMTRESVPEWGCGGNVTFIPHKSLQSENCTLSGSKTHLTCLYETNVCCDPSGQTDCK